jgi:hypothetical protein
MTIITIITRDRDWTAEEQATLNAATADAVSAGPAATADAVSAGTTTGLGAVTSETTYPRTTIRIWTTVEAANAYVAVVNGFTPPPPEAVVQTI